MPKHHRSKPPSPTDVNAFPTEGWLTNDRPIECVVSEQIDKVIGYTAATTIDDGASPPDSTELDDDIGNNCKMSKALYKAFCHHVLGLPPNSWASHQTELAFRNLIIQVLDAMVFY